MELATTLELCADILEPAGLLEITADRSGARQLLGQGAGVEFGGAGPEGTGSQQQGSGGNGKA
jgi:hypothetical protein